MSLGGGANQAVDDAVQRSITHGIVYAVAAGNNNADARGPLPLLQHGNADHFCTANWNELGGGGGSWIYEGVWNYIFTGY